LKEGVSVGDIAYKVAFRFVRTPIGLLAMAFLWLSVIQADAGQQIVSLVTRSDSWGQKVIVDYVLETPEDASVGSILLIIPGGDGVISPSVKEGGIVTYATRSSFFKLVPALLSKGIAVAIPDVPSDAKNGLSYKGRRDRHHIEDLGKVVKDLRKRFPVAKIFVAGSGSGAVSALSFGESERTLSGVVLIGMDSNEVYVHDAPRLKMPVLALHHIEDGCGSSPFIEAKEVAEKASFTFVTLVGGGPDREPDLCSLPTAHGLLGLEECAGGLIAHWIERGSIDEQPVPRDTRRFLNEQVIRVPMKSGSSEFTLQTTIFKPDGPGPFPLIVLSHGVNTDMGRAGEMKTRARFTAQSRLFVEWGCVVAVPMRRGYGSSEGRVNMSLSSIDSFGLEDAKDIQATIDFMTRQPYVDANQVVLVGQSGGGLASLAYGSLGRADIRGIVNFAGGLRTWSPRWEFDMADAFKTYAKTTKVESIWFYSENDRTFPADVARAAYREYQKNGGHAVLFISPAFKTDGHFLFSDPSGIEVWREQTRTFLKQIGIKIIDR
jgi:dienelactone hydrolase